ncbi:MAG: hypothetical protein ACOYJU_08020 [Anaerovoracaceae bacterium]|jgi:hypothetical protein
MMKRAFVVVLAIVMVLALGSCGKKESRTVAAFKDINESTGYHMDLEMKMEGEPIRMDMQAKGDLFYAEATVSGEQVLMIRNAEGFYVLLPSMKMGMKLIDSAEMDQAIKQIGSFMVIGEQAKSEKFKAGDMEVDGSKYYFEEFSSSTEKARFLFEKDELKYILIMDEEDVRDTIKIYAMDAKIDESLFKIPEGYTITDGNL